MADLQGRNADLQVEMQIYRVEMQISSISYIFFHTVIYLIAGCPWFYLVSATPFYTPLVIAHNSSKWRFFILSLVVSSPSKVIEQLAKPGSPSSFDSGVAPIGFPGLGLRQMV